MLEYENIPDEIPEQPTFEDFERAWSGEPLDADEAKETSEDRENDLQTNGSEKSSSTTVIADSPVSETSPRRDDMVGVVTLYTDARTGEQRMDVPVSGHGFDNKKDVLASTKVWIKRLIRGVVLVLIMLGASVAATAVFNNLTIGESFDILFGPLLSAVGLK